jgi:hypothetical protein
MGDEIDHLGLYLQTGFNFAQMEQELAGLAISGMSEDIDRYYAGTDAGINVSKPALAIHPYFSGLVHTVESRHTAGWTTVGLLLLHVGNVHEQGQIVRGMELLRKSVQRDFRDARHINSIMAKPAGDRGCLAVFYIHTSRSGRDHREVASTLAAEAMETESVDRCLQVIRFVEDWNTPYRSIGIMVAPS